MAVETRHHCWYESPLSSERSSIRWKNSCQNICSHNPSAPPDVAVQRIERKHEEARKARMQARPAAVRRPPAKRLDCARILHPGRDASHHSSCSARAAVQASGSCANQARPAAAQQHFSLTQREGERGPQSRTALLRSPPLRPAQGSIPLHNHASAASRLGK